MLRGSHRRSPRPCWRIYRTGHPLRAKSATRKTGQGHVDPGHRGRQHYNLFSCNVTHAFLFQLEPDNIAALNNFAWLEAALLGNVSHAITLLKHAHQLQPDNTTTLFNLGQTYMIYLNSPEEAVLHFLRCAELDPTDVRVVSLLETCW